VKLALAILLVTSVVRADTLAMKRIESENIHLANNQGAVNRNGDIRVDVELIAPDKLKVSSAGKRSDHNLYTSFSTDEVVEWKTAWTGTWTKRAGALELQLVLATDTCTHTKQSSGAPLETITCEPATKNAVVACTPETVALDAAAGAKPASRSAWHCTASSGSLGETVEQWVLGAPGCLKSLGGRGSLAPHFTSC
jgi:hypothetical protein